MGVVIVEMGNDVFSSVDKSCENSQIMPRSSWEPKGRPFINFRY